MNNILISETGEKNLNFGLGALTTEVNFTPVGIIQDVHAGKLRIPDRNPDTTIRSDRYHRFNQYAECRRLASSPSRCR